MYHFKEKRSPSIDHDLITTRSMLYIGLALTLVSTSSRKKQEEKKKKKKGTVQ